jgi:hypothetical protein
MLLISMVIAAGFLCVVARQAMLLSGPKSGRKPEDLSRFDREDVWTR